MPTDVVTNQHRTANLTSCIFSLSLRSFRSKGSNLRKMMSSEREDTREPVGGLSLSDGCQPHASQGSCRGLNASHT